MFYELNIEEQVQNILNKFKYTDLSQRSDNPNIMFDFLDGQLYKDILASEDGPLFDNKEAFTFLINTDGISHYASSNLQIWPIYLAINELPLEKRYSVENVILAGI
jgi:hypothetical protein